MDHQNQFEGEGEVGNDICKKKYPIILPQQNQFPYLLCKEMFGKFSKTIYRAVFEIDRVPFKEWSYNTLVISLLFS